MDFDRCFSNTKFKLGIKSFAIKAKAPGEWEKLGTKIVNMRADHDVLMVTHQDLAIPCPVNNMAALNANIFIVFIILVFFCLLF